MRMLLAMCLVAVATPAVAGLRCTDEPQAAWISETEMKELIAEMGYQIDVFIVTDGNCYEIYGRNSDGRRVEVYFNPANGDVVKASSV